MLFRVVACIVLLFAPACGVVAPQSPTATEQAANVSGVVDQAPPPPTCPADEPCDPQVRVSFVIFTASGGSHRRIDLRADGSFAVQLEPGTYSISASPPFENRVRPSSVIVPRTGSVFLRLRIS